MMIIIVNITKTRALLFYGYYDGDYCYHEEEMVWNVCMS